MYKLENMGDTQKITKDNKIIQSIYLNPELVDRTSDIDKAIETVLAQQEQAQRSLGQTIDAIMNILDPAGQEQREAAAAKQKAEAEAALTNGGRSRSSKKRPTARRRRSSKVRKARKSRTTRRR